MKMTYIRAPLDIRIIMDIERKQSRKSLQVIVADILAEHYEDKLRLLRTCRVIADRANLNYEELYVTALTKKTSNELSAMLPQLNLNQSQLPDKNWIQYIQTKLEKLAKMPLDKIWIRYNDDNTIKDAYLTCPGDSVQIVEVPIHREAQS